MLNCLLLVQKSASRFPVLFVAILFPYGNVCLFCMIKEDFINKVISIVAFCIFFTSVISQFALDIKPCQLCYVTRYLFLAIGICTIALYKLRLFCVALNFATLCFTFYHLGVENHWWEAPQSCASVLPTLSSINSAPDPNQSFCDIANWLVFGISSTLWSFLFSAAIFWVSSLNYTIYRLIKMRR